MLSISAIRRGAESYYLDLDRTDYYAKEGDSRGRWQGRALESIGLRAGNEVEPEALKHLMRGLSPDGRRPLCQNAGRSDHHAGWDLTFSAPKAVSTVWSQAGPELRRAIEECQRKAVSAAIDYLETDVALTRRGKGGREHVPVAGLVVARFDHGTSRTQDPQLHSHVLVKNVTLGSDGKWRTLYAKPIFEAKMTAGALYRADLARGLQEIGLRVERDKNLFTLPDVPKALIARFSTRRREIEEALGAASADARSSERAALLTRSRKKHVPREELLGRWREEGQKAGFVSESILRTIVLSPDRELARVSRDALHSLATEQSYFSSLELLRRLAEHAPGTGLGCDDLRQACSSLLSSSPEIVRLGSMDGKPLFTTRETLNTERKMLGQVRESLDARMPLPDEPTVTSAIRRTEKKLGASLSDEQRAAVLHITQRHGSIQVVTGVAGSGKSALLEAAKIAWEGAGYRVVGTALAGKAADSLQAATGIQSTTLARLLLPTQEKTLLQAYIAAQKAALRNVLHGGFQSTNAFLKYVEKAKQPGKLRITSRVETARDAYAAAKDASGHTWLGFRSTKAFLRHMERVETRAIEVDSKTVLVLDEASMVDTVRMAKLIEEVRKAGAKLVLVGDHGQLQAIGPGGAFAAITKEIGAANLTEIQRQREEWARDAVKKAGAGETLAALREYAGRGCLHVADGRDDAMRALIRDWTTTGAEAPEKNLILTGTRSDATQLNRMAQQARLERGALSYEGVLHRGETLREGDRVLFSRNSSLIDVKNGQLGTIEVLDPTRRQLSVRLDSGQVARFRLADYEHIQLGYSVTTHKAQGSTTENAFVLMGSMQDREISYVQLSRARGQTRLYVDRLLAGDSLSELAKRAGTSHVKELAVTRLEPGLGGVGATKSQSLPSEPPDLAHEEEIRR